MVLRNTALRGILVALALSIMLGGCAAVSGHRRDGAPRLDRLIDAWMRSDVQLREWATVIDVRAILFGWELRRAWTQQQGRDYGWSEGELAEALGRAKAEAATSVEFLLAVYCYDETWNDLGSSQSDWRVLLHVEPSGARFVATSILEEDLPDGLAVRYLDRFTSPWRTVYRVRFSSPNQPIGELLEQAATLDLVIQGPLGRVDMAWSVDPAEMLPAGAPVQGRDG